MPKVRCFKSFRSRAAKALYLILLGFSGLGQLQAQIGEDQAGWVSYANDYFKATDYYFTQGIEVHQRWQHWEAYLAQDGYTPTSIRDPDLRRGDRPYAGTLYAGAYRHVLRSKSKADWRFGAMLGVIGPIAKAEEQQSYIHRSIGDEEPMGWRFQIANDVLFGLEARYRQHLVQSRFIQLSALGEAQFSTYKTRITASSALQLGWPRLRLEVLPAVFVPLFDATLQGGALSNNSPYTLPTQDLRRLVGRLEVGLAARVREGFGLRFSHTYLSREFNGGQAHAWGTLSLGWGLRPTSSL